MPVSLQVLVAVGWLQGRHNKDFRKDCQMNSSFEFEADFLVIVQCSVFVHLVDSLCMWYTYGGYCRTMHLSRSFNSRCTHYIRSNIALQLVGDWRYTFEVFGVTSLPRCSNTQTRSFLRADLSYMQTNVARANRQNSLAAEL